MANMAIQLMCGSVVPLASSYAGRFKKKLDSTVSFLIRHFNTENFITVCHCFRVLKTYRIYFLNIILTPQCHWHCRAWLLNVTEFYMTPRSQNSFFLSWHIVQQLLNNSIFPYEFTEIKSVLKNSSKKGPEGLVLQKKEGISWHFPFNALKLLFWEANQLYSLLWKTDSWTFWSIRTRTFPSGSPNLKRLFF